MLYESQNLDDYLATEEIVDGMGHVISVLTVITDRGMFVEALRGRAMHQWILSPPGDRSEALKQALDLLRNDVHWLHINDADLIEMWKLVDRFDDAG